jgi:alkylation response protein AidB-like acyl-CoA dehydrogenase
VLPVVRSQPEGLGRADHRLPPGHLTPARTRGGADRTGPTDVAKAAALYDAGRDLDAGLAANMAKYASAEAAALAVDTAIQVHGGNGMTTEYGVATLLGTVRATRIAPVSREMILNFVAQHVLGQEKSY